MFGSSVSSLIVLILRCNNLKNFDIKNLVLNIAAENRQK
jgi:hypothetical protein